MVQSPGYCEQEFKFHETRNIGLIDVASHCN
jgi:hypothetical protein